MPRRIPDYPDAYQGWNAVSSFGSLISVSATIIFIYIIYNIFVNNTTATKNPWAIIGYFYGSESTEIETSSSHTIEWTLESPVPLHAYNSLPKQS
jgi:heme/copper-type cytochrome/quinol oxidase subunit 1